MNKTDVLKTLYTIRDEVSLGGGMRTNSVELLSLVEQEYIICEVFTISGEITSFCDIFIKNSGHDFIAYAEELIDKDVDIKNMSYSDIEHFGRLSLLKTLGLMEADEDEL